MAGEGLGILKFGMQREDIKKILGEPDDTEIYSHSDEEGDLTESWHYDDLELSLGFDQIDDWRLVTISVSSGFYEFMEKDVFKLKSHELLKFLKQKGIEDTESDDLSSPENPDYQIIYSDETGMNFWFENGKLSEIQWSPLMLDDGKVKWAN